MNGYRSDRNEFGHGNGGGGDAGTDDFVMTNRYQQAGETWVALASVNGPAVELLVPESALDEIDG